MTDKDGKIINEPQGFMDHLMSAIRYAMESLKPYEADNFVPDETREIADMYATNI
jgi:phage terminase large subunit